MSLSTLINRPCTIIRRTASSSRDDYGNKIRTEQAIPTVCEVQQLRRDEPADQGELSVTQWNAYFPAGTALDTSDVVVVDGLGEFEVVGAPEQKRNPRTRLEGQVEATLVRTKGAEAGS